MCIAIVLLNGCQKNSKQFQFQGEQKKADFMVMVKKQTKRLSPKNLPAVPTDLLDIPESHPLIDISLNQESISCSTDSLHILKVSYKLESSITVMNEGPHCDLIDWHHGYTDWEPLIPNYASDRIKKGRFDFQFKTAPYQIDSLPFPIKDMNRIKEKVGDHCGEFWQDHISKSDTPYEYPTAVGISAYLFRVEAKHPSHSEKQYYFIRIPVMMGC